MSSTWSSRRRRYSSISARSRSLSVAEPSADNHNHHDGVGIGISNKNRPSASVLSSSSNLPSRSYIHHAAFGRSDIPQYSSAGVREQTADLSSSFLTDSDNAPHSIFDLPDPIVTPNSTLRKHGRIEEQSEPATPDERRRPFEYASATEGMIVQTPDPVNDRNLSFSTGGDLRPSSHVPSVSINGSELDEDGHQPNEASPLLPRPRLSSVRKPIYHGELDDTDDDGDDDDEHQTVLTGRRKLLNQLSSLPTKAQHKIRTTLLNPKSWSARKVVSTVIYKPASMLPAVFLGLLLNLLDALSYGIILFPLGEEIFSDMGPDGVSMFYVSCIVSQITYSTGSIFHGGVGSEMIEVVPFFHKMTYTIMESMGTAADPAAVRATVITSYCMSSILTGVVFFVLGSANLGSLVNFFPHSILTGCIGGVGIFLFITGIEVSARMDGGLELSIETFERLFATDTLVLWLPPLGLAILLLTIKHFYDRPWLVPAYYIGITAVFYIITTAVPSINMHDLRSAGWVFEAPAADVPFYNFYSYFRFELVDWAAIWATVPSQFALTFFGILHVPINVPNLAMVVQEDNVSLNRELIMHGISNTLSGCVGSIQNYLVFVNSVLFMNTGADSRLAGYMLALATFGLWVAGPVVIGYVPVMVVGTLIYMLGIDLTMEAVVATYGRLGRLEYVTIVTIAVVMGLYDFVVGIAVGIGLASLVYVVQTSRKTVIRAEFSGQVAESTVRRHPRQRAYLHRVGPQIRIVKLGGYLFFGSIVRVEKKVRALVDAEAFAASPIRYLILDFSHVTGIDFSAAEAFGRMNRILHRRAVELILAGVTLKNEVGRSLSMVGLFIDSEDATATPAPKVFETLNGALEACENELLIILSDKQRSDLKGHVSPPIPVPDSGTHLSVSLHEGIVGSPRRNQLHRAASTTITESAKSDNSKWKSLKQPLPLILQTFQDLTNENEDFWFRAVPYFARREFHRGQLLYSRGDTPDGFYLLQSGILRAEYFLEQGNYHESIVAGTTCGELPFFSETVRTSTVVAERESVAWLLTPEKWRLLQKEDSEVSRELLKVGLKLSAERMNAITSYVLITAS